MDLWKLWKSRRIEGAILERLAEIEAQLKRLEEGEAARELTVAHTLGQLQRLAGRVTKTLALDTSEPKKTNDVILLTPEDVISLARTRGLTR